MENFPEKNLSEINIFHFINDEYKFTNINMIEDSFLELKNDVNLIEFGHGGDRPTRLPVRSYRCSYYCHRPSNN